MFHYTMHNGCAMDIKNLSKDLNIELTTYIPDSRPHEDYIINDQKADLIWERHKDLFLFNDILLFSDTMPMSWCVLKNLNKLPSTTKIILWITNRFNYAIENSKEYYDLINQIKHSNNVYFLFANKFEKLYLNNFCNIDGIKSFDFLPYGKRTIENYNCLEIQNKQNIPYLMNYENETKFVNLKQTLDEKQINYYFKSQRSSENTYCGPFEIINCSCVIHIPYSWSTIAYSEYISLGKSFVLPSLSWLSKHINSLWFQTSKNIDLISSYSLWYDQNIKNGFNYFDNIDHMIDILENKTLLQEKGNICLSYANKIHNDNLEIFKKIMEIK